MTQHHSLIDADWEILAAYVAGALPDAECARIEARMREEPAFRQVAGELGALMPLLVESECTEPAAQQRLLDRLGLDAAQRAEECRPSPSPIRFGAARSPRWQFGFIAVVLALFAGFPIFRRITSDGTGSSKTYTTGLAQHAILDLPDGTRIHLAPGTTLHHTYTHKTTRIQLQGAALFSVPHTASRSFEVVTGSVITRVLGTTFHVQRYNTDTVTQVAVLNGKVALAGRSSDRMATVTPGMTVYATDSMVSTAPSSASDVARWTEGYLVFTRTPIPAMLETLGRWYGYQFRLADSTLATRHVTVAFDVRNPSDMMHTLRTVLDVRPEVNGRIVTLRARRSVSSEGKGQGIPARRMLQDTTFHASREVGK